MYNLYLRVTDEVCDIGKLLAPSNVFPPEQTVNKENEKQTGARGPQLAA